jgi:Domain of unknown function (DUF4365)
LFPQQTVEELLSIAHVQAIAGQAGVSMSYFDLDYGFDGTFRPIRARGSRLVTQGLAIDFQLKASINYIIESEYVVYDIDVKNYNDLIERKLSNSGIHCILLLKTLPTNRDTWLVASEDSLVLAGGCYWAYLNGELSTNSKTVRIRIARNQLFLPESLRWMLNNVDLGIWPC